ncbi:hypothetical protein [Roseibium sp. RKSG952]|uniref:hypothetical protein n=1 Tax=Roseibium sp. RKSG952 TaxID=2529384 RepID=UPI0012BD4D5C|nr:hypothetical protein [Roseibium sp. RKSG952]MTH95218.1 hypothetical protein [Roseibium sp. RKSG952]
MKLTIPFRYRACVIRRKCRNPEDMFFRDTVEFEIPECTGAEAPVAFKWTDKLGRSDFSKSVEIRHFDDSLWAPEGSYLGGGVERHLAIDYVLKTLDPEEGLRNPLFGYIRDVMKYDIANPCEFRFFDRGDRETERRKIEEMCKNLVIIDGMVWARTQEPFYTLRMGNYNSTYLSYKISSCSILSEDPQVVFSALEFDEMVAHHTKLVAGGQEVVNLDDCERIEVLMPEAVMVDRKGPAILKAIKEVLDCDTADMKKWSTERLIQWAGVRDLGEALSSGEPGCDDLEALAIKAHSYACAHLRGFCLDRFEAVFERFEALEIDFNHSTPSFM